MKKFSLSLVVLACLFFLGSSLYDCLLIPEVHFSYSENKCKSIYDLGIKKSCDKLPDKYFIIYVR